MLKKLTVKEITVGQLEFAERAARIPCGYYCRIDCSCPDTYAVCFSENIIDSVTIDC